MNEDITELKNLAIKLADTAGQIARKYFRTSFDIISKADTTPVTIADREIEQELRRLIQQSRPLDGILGEEFGTHPTQSGFTWVLDPIDGTKSFTIGRPTFGTLIALCYDDKPILGIIDQPILKERWIGIQNQPTLFNGTPVKTRSCPVLKSAILGTGGATQIGIERLQRLNDVCHYTVFQGDCYFYGLMANGSLDIIIEDNLELYDYLALVPIIIGAGGVISDWQGKDLTLNSKSQALACGDKIIHQEILKLI